jgi:hypothetical protein
MGCYAELYPDVKEPLMRSFEQACSQIELETDIPDTGGNVEAPSRKNDRYSRRSQRAQQYVELIQSVLELKDAIAPAREIGIQYARVPYTEKNPGLTGIWRVDAEKPYKLIDCAIYFTDINRPHSASKSTDYSGTLLAINAQGERKEISFTRDDLEDKGFDAKLVGFADWPHMPTHKYWLLEALKHLMREKDVAIHDQYSSLGWAQHAKLGLVWIANNGVETANSFLPSEKAPFVAPALLSPGNGYRALTELPKQSALNESIWELLLSELNSQNWARMYGKLGASMRVIFPDGTVERSGKLDFVIETVGEGSGQGKSAEDNYVLSLLGTDFTYDRPPLIGTDDTSPARPRLMEAMSYLAFMTEDRKAREGSPDFPKQHATRRKLIEQYSDNTGGGVKMSAYGRTMVSRGNPQGFPLLTGNADHSAYAFKSETGGEEMIEWRACTFILSPDEKANYEVSKCQINPRRRELTAWGTYERRWIMQQYNKDKAAFMLRVQSWYAQASERVFSIRERVFSIRSEWAHTRPMNACIDMVWGMLARQAFIEDIYPDTYQEHFLWGWIDVLTDAFIENRVERAGYLQSLIAKRSDANKLEDFVLDTIRYCLGTSQGYIASQQDKILQPEDAPLSLSQFGMRHNQTFEGNETWSTGQCKLGYFLARKDALAFNFDLLYPILEVAALKSKYPLPGKQDFKRKFAETGVPTVKRDEFGDITRSDASEWINGKAGQYITIPLRVLYPISTETKNEDEEEQILQEVENTKVVTIRRPAPEQTQDKQRVPIAVASRDMFSITPDEVPEDHG